MAVGCWDWDGAPVCAACDAGGALGADVCPWDDAAANKNKKTASKEKQPDLCMADSSWQCGKATANYAILAGLLLVCSAKTAGNYKAVRAN